MRCLQLQASILTLALLTVNLSIANSSQIGDNIGPYTVTNIISISSSTFAEDIVYANDSFYCVDYSGGLINRIDKAGNLIDTWQIPNLHINPEEIMHGIAFDGTSFYTTARNIGASWRKLTLGTAPNVTVNLKKSWPTDSWAMDLTYANGYLFYPDYLGFPNTYGGYDGAIRKVAPQTLNIVDTFRAPSNFIYGMAFDGTNLLASNTIGPPEGGPTEMWVISPSNGMVLETWMTNVKALGMDYDIPNKTLYVLDSYRNILTATIPEPATVLLLGFGAVVLRKWTGFRVKHGTTEEIAS